MDVVAVVTIMSKKTYYKLWFAIGALYLLGAIYPLNVAQRTAGHRGFSIVMGVFFLSIGMTYKKKYEKSMTEGPATSPTAKISQ
jgi:hypothetical protein